MISANPPSHWDEDTTERFLDYGNYFIPARQQQMRLMAHLLKDLPPAFNLLELCCGEGLLAELILDTYPNAHYCGLDGSARMLKTAGQKLSRFDARVGLGVFELEDHSWRRLEESVQAVVSSLAIHHLGGAGKQALFTDVFMMLAQGGVFIISDMMEPATLAGRRVAADAWDEIVRQRSLELDGSTAGLDFFLRERWNTFRYPDPDDIDHPSPLFDQLKWMEQAGFSGIDVHFMQAGHALFSGWKLDHHK